MYHRLTLGIAAGANSSNETVKSPVGGVIDYPTTFLILVHLFCLEIEDCLLIQVVSLPQLPHLAQDLLAVGVTSFPLYRRVKPVH
jgi:hypothetical protein